MLLAEIDLPTILFGFVTAATTAVVALYKDMRRDMKTITENAQLERVKCDREIMRLYKEIDEIKKMPCHKADCPLNQK